MKYTLTLAILLLAATGWGQTNELLLGTSPPPVALNYMACSASNEVLNVESHIRKLAASGEICKVFGHWYEDLPSLYVINPTPPRKCKLCGKVEPDRRTRK